MGMTPLQGLSEWLLGMTTDYSRVGVPEWLSGMTRNHAGFACAGSYLQGLPEWLLGMTTNYGRVGMLEWLLGMTRNHVGFARARSNPATHDPHMTFFSFFSFFQCVMVYFFNRRDDPELKPHSNFSSGFVLCGFVRPSTRFTFANQTSLVQNLSLFDHTSLVQNLSLFDHTSLVQHLSLFDHTRRSCCSSG